MVWSGYTLAIIHRAVVLSVCLKMKKVVSTIVHADNQIPVSLYNLQSEKSHCHCQPCLLDYIQLALQEQAVYILQFGRMPALHKHLYNVLYNTIAIRNLNLYLYGLTLLQKSLMWQDYIKYNWSSRTK